MTLQGRELQVDEWMNFWYHRSPKPFWPKKYVVTFLQEQLAPLQILGAIPEHNRDQCDSYAVTRDVP